MFILDMAFVLPVGGTKWAKLLGGIGPDLFHKYPMMGQV